MQASVVALEYREDTKSGTAASRVAIREHAYELATATLAGHPGQELPGWDSPVGSGGGRAALTATFAGGPDNTRDNRLATRPITAGVEHSPGNAYPGDVASYINGVFCGTIAHTDHMPAGLHLYLPQ